MIRITAALLGAGALVSGLTAQSDQEKYEKKLKKEFVSNASWVQSLDAAKAKAAQENKLIFGYFSRSYAP